MRYRAVLITGGAGFVGSNLAVHLKCAWPRLTVTVLDNLSRRGSELNLPRLREHGVRFRHGDVRCAADFDCADDVGLVIDCAAEPSVVAETVDPARVVNTNLLSTLNTLEFCRIKKADVLFISTSRVYPFKALNAIAFTETQTRYAWKRPLLQSGVSAAGVSEDFTTAGLKTLYGASKLASEELINEYSSLYGIRSVINRCGVIAGPWQFGRVDQGVFTHWMLAHYFKKDLDYIGFAGSGKQVRDLLHVDDLCSLVDAQLCAFHRLKGGTFNVGGGSKNTLSLRETTDLCRKISGNRVRVGRILEQRGGDVRIYISDSGRISQAVGWRPRKSVESILADTHAWIADHEKVLKRCLA